MAVVPPATVRVRRGRQPFGERAGELAHKAVETLAATLAVRAFCARPSAARSAVTDPLEDLERLAELLALGAEQLVQLGALHVGQGGSGEAAETRWEERPGEEPDGEVAGHLIDTRSQVRGHDAAVAAASRHEPRAVHPAAALGLLLRPARARVVAPGRGARRVDVDVAESHRQHRNSEARDGAQRGRTGVPLQSGCGSIRSPATLPVLRFCGAGRRLCSERPGGYPVFLICEVATRWGAPAGGNELVASPTR